MEPTPATESSSKSYHDILKEHPLYEQVRDLVHWRDPTGSALLFGSINCLCYLLSFTDYTLVAIVGYLLLTLLVVCFAYVQFVQLRGKYMRKLSHVENPFVERFKDTRFAIPRRLAEGHVGVFSEVANNAISQLQDAFFCTNLVLSLKTAGALYGIAVVGQWFSALTFIWIGSIVLFVWPRLYEEKHAEIDQGVALAKSHVVQGVHAGASKLPPNVQNYVHQLFGVPAAAPAQSAAAGKKKDQ